MRMRLKKHLEERIAQVSDLIVAREGDYFYKLSDKEKQALRMDLHNIFGNDRPIVLELGCGKGAWSIGMAQMYPYTNFLAVEKLSNVIVAAGEQAKAAGVNNLRFANVRAENLGYWLPKHCAQRIALNFSCPFPKKTYANRRLTSARFLELYRDLLTDDGYVTQKTDNCDFITWSAESFLENNFIVSEINTDTPLSETEPATEYETKFRADGKPIYSLSAHIAR